MSIKYLGSHVEMFTHIIVNDTKTAVNMSLLQLLNAGVELMFSLWEAY